MGYLDTRHFSTIKDVEAFEPEFIILVNDSETVMGHDYGPPDPPPTWETHNKLTVVSVKDEAALIEWIEQNTRSYRSKTFKVLQYKPVTIKTETKIVIS